MTPHENARGRSEGEGKAQHGTGTGSTTGRLFTILWNKSSRVLFPRDT